MKKTSETTSSGKKIRVSASITPEHKEKWDLLENKSAFVEICIDNMVDIIHLHLLKKEDPETYDSAELAPLDDLAVEFNKKYKNNKMNRAKKGLIKKENGKWVETNSQPTVDNWL